VHGAEQHDTFGCQICHGQAYTGGFLYDGLYSTTSVAQATFTLTAEDGTVLTAVTDPAGLFYFPGLVPAPYTICVSKCSDSVCSGPEYHPDDSDCRTCHNSDETQLHLPKGSLEQSDRRSPQSRDLECRPGCEPSCLPVQPGRWAASSRRVWSSLCWQAAWRSGGLERT